MVHGKLFIVLAHWTRGRAHRFVWFLRNAQRGHFAYFALRKEPLALLFNLQVNGRGFLTARVNVPGWGNNEAVEFVELPVGQSPGAVYEALRENARGQPQIAVPVEQVNGIHARARHKVHVIRVSSSEIHCFVVWRFLFPRFRAADKSAHKRHAFLPKWSMQSGWVIVYVPGGNIYQMLDVGVAGKQSLKQRILRGSVKTFLTCVQLYWWFKD